MSDRELQDRLVEFVLGELNHVEREEIEAHLAANEHYLEEVGAVSNALASLATALSPVEPSAALRTRLLDSVEARRGRYAQYAARVARLLDLGVEKVQQLLDSLGDEKTWEQGPFEGTSLVHLATGPAVVGAHAGFVRVMGGMRFPRHEHLGEERVFVLQGTCRDEDGTIKRAGDEIVMAGGTSHDFVVFDGPDFIYLVVLEGGVKFEVEPTTPIRGVPSE